MDDAEVVVGRAVEEVGCEGLAEQLLGSFRIALEQCRGLLREPLSFARISWGVGGGGVRAAAAGGTPRASNQQHAHRDAPPPQPPTPQLDNLNANAEKIAISEVPVETDIEMTGGFSLGVGEGDYLPIVKVAPIYPNRALTRGIEGFCVVQYTVTRQGTVKDPVVVESQCSSSLFHSASVNAALKFKYKPRIMDGTAVEVPGVQNKFTYEITE